MLGAQATCGVGEGAYEEGDDLRVGKGLEGVDAAAGEQGSDDLEGGIFRCCADEADGAALDPGKEGVLLRFVEAVNFIDEEDGAGSPRGGFLRIGHHLLDFFYAGEDGGELDEGGFGCVRDDLGEGGFADAWRAPEDHGIGIVALDLNAEGLAGAEEVLLAEELVEGAGAHSLGEGRGDCAGVAGFGCGVEEAHEVAFSIIAQVLV